MPTYEYKCNSCGNIQEEIHSIKLSAEEADIHCKECGEHPMVRIISKNGNIIFKGEGWATKRGRIAGQMRKSQEKAEKQQALNWDKFGKSQVVPNVGGMVTGEAGDPQAWRKAGEIASKDAGASPDVVKQYEEKAQECEDKLKMPDHLKTVSSLPLPSGGSSSKKVSGPAKVEEKSIKSSHQLP